MRRLMGPKAAFKAPHRNRIR